MLHLDVSIVLALVSFIFAAGVAWGVSRASTRGAGQAAGEAERKAQAAHLRLDRLTERLRVEDIGAARLGGAMEERIRSLERELQMAREDLRHQRDEFTGLLSRVELRLEERSER